MGKKDPRVDAYVDRAAPFARPVLSHLRTVVHRACPEVEETMKWGFPHFQYKGMLCSMAAFKAHCAFGFWQGKRVLGDEARGGAMGQLGRITSVSGLPARTALATLVRRAAALNDQGVTAPRTRRTAPRPVLRVPPDLAAALRRDRRASATFQGLSPSKRRDYLEWIVGAKGQETRRRRVATAVAWLAEGKSRNWKYERCSDASRHGPPGAWASLPGGTAAPR